ncbi:hypothetical protein B9Z55_028287 [Caenorhabditis nigoni]|uniref:MADF domain-containing protein n=1 Tax=Caenorhabditis nigoni TaxID=1611254 RepID=A0A2G5SCI1_9PELO|nr:hypothetical protein B9Z55_028287 [Caenorhabditis nigoni]
MPKRIQKDQSESSARKRVSRSSQAVQDPAPDAHVQPPRTPTPSQDPNPDIFVRPPPGTDSCLWKVNAVPDPFPKGGKMDFHRPMDQYMNMKASKFEPIGWGPEDVQIRNAIYYLIGTREETWKKKGRVNRNDFNDVSRRLYWRTEKLISGKSCLEVWIQGRKQLREMLRTSIEELKLDSIGTESHLMETLPSYPYLKFARELFHEYEIELRVKFLGDAADADEELIKKVEEEDYIRFEDEEESSDANPTVQQEDPDDHQQEDPDARMEEEDPEEGRDTSDLPGDASPAHSAPPALSSPGPDRQEDGGDDVPEQEFDFQADDDFGRIEEDYHERVDKDPEETMETSDLAGLASPAHSRPPASSTPGPDHQEDVGDDVPDQDFETNEEEDTARIDKDPEEEMNTSDQPAPQQIDGTEFENQQDDVLSFAPPASSSPDHQEDGGDNIQDIPGQEFEYNPDYDSERPEEQDTTQIEKDPEEIMETSDRPAHASSTDQQINEVQLDLLQADVLSSAKHASSSPAHQENEKDEDNAPFVYNEDEYVFEVGFREPSTSSRPAGTSRSHGPRHDHREDDDFDFGTNYNVPSTSSRPPGTSRAHGDSFFGSMDKVPQPPCSSTRSQTPYHQEGTLRDSEEGEKEKDDAQDPEDSHEEDRARANFVTLRFRRFLKTHPELVDDQMFNEIYAMALTGSTVFGDMKKRFAASAQTGRHIEMYGRMNQNQLRSVPGFVKDPIQREGPRNVPRKTLKEYQEKLEETRKKRKNTKEELLDTNHRTTLFDCIYRTSDVWRTRRTPAPASDWEKVGVKLYARTGQAYSVKRMRKTWQDAKRNMFLALEKKKKESKPAEQIEEEMWECYSHLLWYRIYKEEEDELSGQKEAEEVEDATQEPKDWVKELEIADKLEFEAFLREDMEPEDLPHFPMIPDNTRFKNEELQTAQTMDYPKEFDENDRMLRDVILQPLLSCQEQEGKALIQKAFLFYLGAIGKGLNGPPSFRFDQLRKNVIN